jgi:hypothetical protein
MFGFNIPVPKIIKNSEMKRDVKPNGRAKTMCPRVIRIPPIKIV